MQPAGAKPAELPALPKPAPPSTPPRSGRIQPYRSRMSLLMIRLARLSLAEVRLADPSFSGLTRDLMLARSSVRLTAPTGTERKTPIPPTPLESHKESDVECHPPSDCPRLLIVSAGGFVREVLHWARDDWPDHIDRIGNSFSKILLASTASQQPLGFLVLSRPT
jgi:hypothetical protein